jgi:hypothetical protein
VLGNLYFCSWTIKTVKFRQIYVWNEANKVNLIIHFLKLNTFFSHLTNARLAHKSVWVLAGQGQEYYLHAYRHNLEGGKNNYISKTYIAF